MVQKIARGIVSIEVEYISGKTVFTGIKTFEQNNERILIVGKSDYRPYLKEDVAGKTEGTTELEIKRQHVAAVVVITREILVPVWRSGVQVIKGCEKFEFAEWEDEAACEWLNVGPTVRFVELQDITKDDKLSEELSYVEWPALPLNVRAELTERFKKLVLEKTAAAGKTKKSKSVPSMEEPSTEKTIEQK